jgi:hypothetical protein
MGSLPSLDGILFVPFRRRRLILSFQVTQGHTSSIANTLRAVTRLASVLDGPNMQPFFPIPIPCRRYTHQFDTIATFGGWHRGRTMARAYPHIRRRKRFLRTRTRDINLICFASSRTPYPAKPSCKCAYACGYAVVGRRRVIPRLAAALWPSRTAVRPCVASCVCYTPFKQHELKSHLVRIHLYGIYYGDFECKPEHLARRHPENTPMHIS